MNAEHRVKRRDCREPKTQITIGLRADRSYGDQRMQFVDYC